MMDGLGAWIKGIAGAAIICGAALAITPKGRVREVLKVLCGLLLIVAVVSPFIGAGLDGFSIDLARYRQQADSITGAAEKEQTNLSRTIIEREVNTYILDKAQSLGIEDMVPAVVLKWGDEGFWYPYEVDLKTDAGGVAKGSLTAYIEGELGIPESRQHWKPYSSEEVRDEN
jgi:stage III sporulation protein AF